ncbi:hypothetical protein P154DRAFT_36280 [Amniculicola lignicola CBS 123094]|uniref:Uncharacterized protein n=1 Tax=Amniculicola lignicola CBS 123094 TaxID=1392246 RepID=A0A6A5WSL8_9PLEO|nr:hypothetical protein P154DRAFT_36280 [Amniculicola lignicola CBS 123094]
MLAAMGCFPVISPTDHIHNQFLNASLISRPKQPISIALCRLLGRRLNSCKSQILPRIRSHQAPIRLKAMSQKKNSSHSLHFAASSVPQLNPQAASQLLQTWESVVSPRGHFSHPHDDDRGVRVTQLRVATVGIVVATSTSSPVSVQQQRLCP